MKIKVEQKFSYLLITINEIPHLMFKTVDFIGIQAWVEGKEKFIIEYHFSSGAKITSEYDNKEKFTSITSQLQEVMWGF